jgi:predicted acetyltransferase
LTFDVRPAASREEFTDAVLAIAQYVGRGPLDEVSFERYQRVLPLERMHAAFDDGAVVGGAAAFPFEVSVPGGARVRCSGVSIVGVYPTHRRRGVLRAMMRAQLDDVHRRGEPLAALWSSEETIYGRYGYGLTGWVGEIALGREYATFAHPFERRGRIRFVEAEEAKELLPPVWERVMEQRPGMFLRPRAWWEDRVIADAEERREPGEGPKRFVVCELDGEVRGYAIYRHHPKWEAGVSAGRLGVLEALAVDPEATRELWRYLLEIDWAATVEAWVLPPDHPLFLLLATPRRMRYRLGDGLWVRLVEVGAALSARSYAIDDAIVFDVADAFCPWNEGRWKLEGGRASRTDEEPDLRLDVGALGSGYLGGITFTQLAAALRVEELQRGALERADAMFRSSVHPWCPEIF